MAMTQRMIRAASLSGLTRPPIRMYNAGKVTQVTYPTTTNLTATYGYDAADRLTNVLNKQGTTTISSFHYTLNDTGNRTQMVEFSGTTTYNYDNIGRLTSATYPGSATDTYSYDADGNRPTKNSTTFSYDDASQLTSAGTTTYGYDANGNQTSRNSDSFTWSELNRLSSLTIGGTTTSYAYNGDGLRDSKTDTSGTIHYTWDLGSKVPNLLRDGSLNYVYGLNRIMSLSGSTVVNYYLYDGLGSVANVTDAGGNVVCSYTYDAFGAIRTEMGSATNYFGFAGEQRDNESGYIYLRNRYYDSDSGRFLSLDPNGNGYPYVGGNPINNVDPTGLDLTVACDAFSGDTCVAAHFEGTASDVANQLSVLDSTPGGTETAVYALLQSALNNGGAPIDDSTNSAVLISDTYVSPDAPAVGLSTIVSTGVVASGLCNCTSTAGAAGTVYGPPAPPAPTISKPDLGCIEGVCFDFNEDLAKATLKCYSAESNFVVQDVAIDTFSSIVEVSPSKFLTNLGDIASAETIREGCSDLRSGSW